MATTRSYFIPGWGYINEVKGNDYIIPGWGYINETVSSGGGLTGGPGVFRRRMGQPGQVMRGQSGYGGQLNENGEN